MYSSNMHSSNMYSSNMHSSNMHSSSMHSSNMHSSNMQSSNMQSSNMHSSTYPCDEFISCDLFNLCLSEHEPDVVPSPTFQIPLQYITPAFVDPDINDSEMADEMYRSIEFSTRDSEKREWGPFCLLDEDTIGRSASLPWESSLSDYGSQTQVELASLNCGSMRDLGGDEAPVRAGCQQTPQPLSPSPTIKKSSRLAKRSSRRTHGSAMSRNVQATINEVEGLKDHLSGRIRGHRPTNVCPISGCKYRQANGRMPDLRRHIKTHFRKISEIRCTEVLTEHGMWIGGCLKTFSRRDALKRHMRNNHVCAHPRPSRHFYL